MDDKYIVEISIWRSSFEAPMVGSGMTYMVCRYTDGLQPQYEFARHFKDSWRNQDREVITRPFVWTRIPE